MTADALLQEHFVDCCVKGIGKAITKELWQKGWLNTSAGLYSITKVGLILAQTASDLRAWLDASSLAHECPALPANNAPAGAAATAKQWGTRGWRHAVQLLLSISTPLRAKGYFVACTLCPTTCCLAVDDLHMTCA